MSKRPDSSLHVREAKGWVQCRSDPTARSASEWQPEGRRAWRHTPWQGASEAPMEEPLRSSRRRKRLQGRHSDGRSPKAHTRIGAVQRQALGWDASKGRHLRYGDEESPHLMKRSCAAKYTPELPVLNLRGRRQHAAQRRKAVRQALRRSQRRAADMRSQRHPADMRSQRRAADMLTGFGPGLWAGAFNWGFGPGLQAGDLGRGLGPGLWARGLGRGFGLRIGPRLRAVALGPGWLPAQPVPCQRLSGTTGSMPEA
eukprot:286209-Chlamydomonas_euryale.AAC.1